MCNSWRRRFARCNALAAFGLLAVTLPTAGAQPLAGCKYRVFYRGRRSATFQIVGTSIVTSMPVQITASLNPRNSTIIITEGDNSTDISFDPSASTSDPLDSLITGMCGNSFTTQLFDAIKAMGPALRGLSPAATSASNPTAAQGSTYVLAADVNNDGIADSIAIVSGRLIVNVLSASGSVTSTSTYKVDGNAANIAAADFDGDGHLDLAVTDAWYDATGGSIQVLWGNGDGTFTAPQNVPGGPSPASIAAADFNGDGKPDIAAANPDNKTVAIVLGTGGRTFSAPVTYPAGLAASSMVAADFNGDGSPDLAILDSAGSGVAVLPNTGSGALSSAIASTGGNSRGGGGTLAYADFNRDGKPDLLAVYQNDNILSLLINSGKGSFQPALNYVGDTDMESAGIVPLQGGSAAVLTSDKITGSVSITPAPGDGTLSAPPIYRVGGTLTGVAAVDVNGDKIPDLITAGSNGVSVQLGDGQGNFGAPVFYPTASQPVAIAAADFNQDKSTDLAVAMAGGIAILLNNGSGVFRLASTYPAGSNPVDLRLADFNGDGKLDLAELDAGAGGQGAVWILPGAGGGTFGAGANYTLGSGGLFSFTIADLNGDGIPDVAATAAASTSGNVEILLGNSNGTLRSPVSIPLGYPASIAAADFNADGKMDLAVSGVGVKGNLGITVLLGTGGGAFQTGPFIGANSAGNLTAVDLNGDGRPDLLNTSCCGETDITYLLGNGDGSLQPEVHVQAGASPVAVAVADLDGDGQPDLSIVDRSGYSLALLNGFLPLVTLSAGNPYQYTLAPESLAVVSPTVVGPALAAQTGVATTATWPTSIDGTSVTVVDSAGVSRPAPLYFASPKQVNYEVPQGTAPGTALVTVNLGPTSSSALTQIANVSPGIFTLDAAGLVAAIALRVSAGGDQTVQNVYQADSLGNISANPVNLGASTDQVYLLIYGTGFRNAAAGSVAVTIGGVNAAVAYAGAGGGTPGLDQINAIIPKSLAGAGDVPVMVTAAGVAANPVRVTVQ